MNILQALIKDNFEATEYVSNEEISVALAEELEILLDENINDTSIEEGGYDRMEWDEFNEVTFYFWATFDDMPYEWHKERNCYAWISFHKDTNWEDPYVDRDSDRV